jgi:hypothetical protein
MTILSGFIMAWWIWVKGMEGHRVDLVLLIIRMAIKKKGFQNLFTVHAPLLAVRMSVGTSATSHLLSLTGYTSIVKSVGVC